MEADLVEADVVGEERPRREAEDEDLHIANTAAKIEFIKKKQKKTKGPNWSTRMILFPTKNPGAFPNMDRTRFFVVLLLFVVIQSHRWSPIYPLKDTKQCFPALFTPAIVLIGCNRPESTLEAIESLLGLDEISDFSLYVSLDQCGNVEAIERMLLPHQGEIQDLWRHKPDVKNHSKLSVRQRISVHYEFAMTQAFARNHSHLILVEDDMVFSPDFLRFFLETGWLLDTDPTLFCISSWNDNGFRRFAQNGAVLRRTEYFPGLGWMIKRELWESEWREKWPGSLYPNRAVTGWDHWLRLPDQTLGRHCIFPEVPRNRNRGSQGANVRSSEFDSHLRRIAFNEDKDVVYQNMETLLLVNYERNRKEEIENSHRLLISDVRSLFMYFDLQMDGKRSTKVPPNMLRRLRRVRHSKNGRPFSLFTRENSFTRRSRNLSDFSRRRGQLLMAFW